MKSIWAIWQHFRQLLKRLVHEETESLVEVVMGRQTVLGLRYFLSINLIVQHTPSILQAWNSTIHAANKTAQHNKKILPNVYKLGHNPPCELVVLPNFHLEQVVLSVPWSKGEREGPAFHSKVLGGCAPGLSNTKKFDGTMPRSPCNQDLVNILPFLTQTGNRGKKKKKKSQQQGNKCCLVQMLCNKLFFQQCRRQIFFLCFFPPLPGSHQWEASFPTWPWLPVPINLPMQCLFTGRWWNMETVHFVSTG